MHFQLEYLRKLNIHHCDIKPENIIICKDWKLKLADFGIAEISEEEEKLIGAKGTPGYWAPEIAKLYESCQRGYVNLWKADI